MKEIVAIIRPNRYFATKRRLIINGFNAMSTKEVIGRGKQRVVFRAESNAKETVGIKFIAKRYLDIFARDADVEKIIRLLMDENSTGHPGDGKIFVLPAEEALRIRTGERGDDVLV
ncbi:MAG: P-II family nitrogen regulator [Selenomonadaceae bacterium]|nr:P-II family nitrogen regulator [Selenomonadaceae bacterium]